VPERPIWAFKKSLRHWGALDGSNAYKDFDTAVIFGLPFRIASGDKRLFAFQASRMKIGTRIPVEETYECPESCAAENTSPPSIIQAIAAYVFASN